MAQQNYFPESVQYIDRPNHLIISSPHFLRLQSQVIPEFVKKLEGLAGMKAESSDGAESTLPFDCIEVMSKVAMLGKPYEYIASQRQNGGNLGDVLEEYGVPMPVIELHYALLPLAVIKNKPITSADELFNAVISSLAIGQKRIPKLNTERTVANFTQIMDLISANKFASQDLMIFSNIYLQNHGYLIEYEFMQPDILDFRKRIDGRIGVQIGAFHSARISEALDGKLIERPKSWDDYRSELPRNSLEIISTIESLVLST